MAIPKTAQELLLDGVPDRPLVVTLNVAVQPATASISIYLSESDSQPILCRGQKQITIECGSGRIFVDKNEPNASYQISVVSRG